MIRLIYRTHPKQQPPVRATFEHEGSIENGYGDCEYTAIYDAIRKTRMFAGHRLQLLGQRVDGRSDGMPARTAERTLWEADDDGAAACVVAGVARVPQAAAEQDQERLGEGD